jgi:SAM-dependent methyltransferase
VREWGERIPLADRSQDAVHVRQVLHHAFDLRGMLKEIHRILRPGGVILATREHVVDNDEQLKQFRAQHPLHGLYGGENAFSLQEYKDAIGAAGLELKQVFGTISSILNFFPGTEAQRQERVRSFAAARWRGLGRLLVVSNAFLRWQAEVADQSNHAPGRIYSFLAAKPR